LETIRVGTGDWKGSVSAGATRLIWASLSHESSSRESGGRREFDHIAFSCPGRVGIVDSALAAFHGRPGLRHGPRGQHRWLVIRAGTS
jgi:hypothetical protein